MPIRRLWEVIPWLLLGPACLAQVLVVPSGRPRTPELSPAQQAVLRAAFKHYFGRPREMDEFTTLTKRLANHGPPAIFAISNDTNRINAYLVFRQEQGADVLILRAFASNYRLLSSRHSDYSDIRLESLEGIHDMISIWRYDGRSYRIATCADRDETDGTATAAPLNYCGDNP